MGTSAEFASFDLVERRSAIETIVRSAEGRVPVIANVSDASTRLTIRHAYHALEAGASAIAATPPYYYPHSQDEVLAHFRAIRAAVDAPLFVYNIPQTVRVRMELSTMKTLADEGTADGIKDSQNDLEWFRQLALFVREKNLPFAAFVGTRSLIDAAVLVGAHGAIPSVANAYPRLCLSAYQRAEVNDFAGARELENKIIAIEGVTAARSSGSRNAAVLGLLKHILHQRGIIDNPGLTAPLRSSNEAEAHAWLRRVDELDKHPDPD